MLPLSFWIALPVAPSPMVLLALFVREPKELLFASIAAISVRLVIDMLLLEVPIVRFPPVQIMPVEHEIVTVVLLDTEGQVVADAVEIEQNNKLKTKSIFLIIGFMDLDNVNHYVSISNLVLKWHLTIYQL